MLQEGKDAPKGESKDKVSEVTALYEREVGRLNGELREKTQRILNLESTLKKLKPLQDVLTSLLRPAIEEIVDGRIVSK